MSNLNYRGTSQPVTSGESRLLGRLGAIFGGVTTPTYHGDGQPSPGAGGSFGAVTPRYKDTPPVMQSCDVAMSDVVPLAPVIIPIDRDELLAGRIAVVELAPGKIAIVVPRDVCARDASVPVDVEAALVSQQPDPQEQQQQS